MVTSENSEIEEITKRQQELITKRVYTTIVTPPDLILDNTAKKILMINYNYESLEFLVDKLDKQDVVVYYIQKFEIHHKAWCYHHIKYCELCLCNITSYEEACVALWLASEKNVCCQMDSNIDKFVIELMKSHNRLTIYDDLGEIIPVIR